MLDPNGMMAGLRALAPDVPQLLADGRPRITVLGDLMLDGWWIGDVHRLCREAPAPVVDIRGRSYAPGGAGNTAMNLAALGAEVRMVGFVGADDDGALLRRLMEQAGVDTSGVLELPGNRTLSKSRIVSADQIMLRVDDGGGGPVAGESVAALAAAVLDRVRDADAVVICDYGSGALPTALAPRLRDAAPEDTLFVVDAHDARPWAGLCPDLVTPNAQEAGLMVGSPLPSAHRPGWVREHAEDLLTATGAAAAVVTLDADGTVLADRTGIRHRTWTKPATDKQASGAGDTFVAALTLCRASGVPLSTSLDFAQAAADIVVHHFGTSVCSTADLSAHLASSAESILDLNHLLAEISRARQNGRRIVLTNGCFDVLHRGHTSYLNQARQLGDILVVAVNGDASTRRLKGEGRPINPARDRAGVLAALSCVDYVTVFDTDTPIPLIEVLRPDVYTKGGDYTPEMLEETEAVEAYGGIVEILDYVADHSTSALVERIGAVRTAQPAPASPDGFSSPDGFTSPASLNNPAGADGSAVPGRFADGGRG
ncbi:MAG TPA: D-glycero-beta-D-manno-heptose 1-phosphate adenylyltransferase [Micrococcaceae bacterium]|nr:D-glycero-beta-D-manno-heptose 1-phosphate adenylyltransferase [Micrococcaceae bacterium]